MLLFISGMQAETIVNANISSNQTWSPAGSPYIVTIDAWVYNYDNPVLTIEAGTEVRFEPGASLRIGGTSNTSHLGSLQVQGTLENPVLFQPNGAEAWEGLIFQRYATEGGSSLEYAQISGGGSNGPMVQVDNGTPVFSHCSFSSAVQSGFKSVNTTDAFSMTECDFTNCGTYPIETYTELAHCIAASNSFSGNGSDAVKLMGSHSHRKLPCTGPARALRGHKQRHRLRQQHRHTRRVTSGSGKRTAISLCCSANHWLFR